MFHPPPEIILQGPITLLHLNLAVTLDANLIYLNLFHLPRLGLRISPRGHSVVS